MGDTPTGARTWLVLWKAARSVEARAHASIEETGLGATDFAILETLLHKGPLPVNVIGRKVLLTTGSITTAVEPDMRNSNTISFFTSDSISRSPLSSCWIISMLISGATVYCSGITALYCCASWFTLATAPHCP